MMESDIKLIEAIHKESFSGTFLGLLGPRFLYKYFNSLLKYNDAINLVVVSENSDVVGYIVGTKNPKKFYRTLLLEHFSYIVCNCIVSLAKKPTYFLKIIDGIFTTSDKYYIQTCSYMIFTIAVSRAARGSSAATDLINKFVEICEDRGIEEVYLNVDTKNSRAISFYEKLGFKSKTSYSNVDKSQMKIYSKNLVR
jgi:ribosomal protein S18 acetylase RimI-like enzyme